VVRLFVPAKLLSGGKATVTPADWAYLTTVLRLRAGDALEIFDGAGMRVAAQLSATARELELVGSPQADAPGAGPRLSLWQGLPKGEKLELVIQKAAELGAAEIVPLECRRSIAKLPAARAAAKLARWRKIAVEAARQCGRADLPEVGEPADIEALCALARGGMPVLVLYEALAGQGEVAGLAAQLDALREAPRLAIAVGPEGGFDPAEIAALVAAGARPARLGRRILRTETAGIVACALWALCAGELG
jgi:16S rRNA (uracil1498-N3)-methyltransferase